MREKLDELLAAMTAYVVAFMDVLGLREDMEAMARTKFAADTSGQLGFQTVIAASVVVIAVMLVVIVVDQFDQSLGDPASSDLNNASNDVMGGYADMAGLVGPLLIVAIAVVIISLIRRAQS